MVIRDTSEEISLHLLLKWTSWHVDFRCSNVLLQAKNKREFNARKTRPLLYILIKHLQVLHDRNLFNSIASLREEYILGNGTKKMLGLRLATVIRHTLEIKSR